MDKLSEELEIDETETTEEDKKPESTEQKIEEVEKRTLRFKKSVVEK